MTRQEIDSVVQTFQAVHYKWYGNHSYSSGYLGSLVTQLLQEIPESDAQRILDQLGDATHIAEQQILKDILQRETA